MSRSTYESSVLYSFAELIALEYFQSRENLLHWTKEARLEWPLPGFDQLTDKEVLLNIAEHCKGCIPKLKSFLRASPALLGDKSFMLRVVEHYGELLSCTAGNLWQDFDLVLIAFAQSRPSIEFYRGIEWSWNSLTQCTLEQRRRFVLEFRNKAVVMIDQHQYFCDTFLRALCSSSGSPASMLNLGLETSQAHLQCIADFLDVPIGTKLRRLRQAEANLINFGTGYRYVFWAPHRGPRPPGDAREGGCRTRLHF